MTDLFRYAAFISYSSRDASFAKRLHRALESYGIPSALGAFDLLGGGGKKNRIYPVFRDREELSAGDLGERIEASLRASAALIVICSPNGAASPWVQKEIEYFVGLGRRDKVFAIIAPTAPLVDNAGHDLTTSSFPRAFRGDALAGDGALEPLAADVRKGKDGFRNAWLKIVAGMIGVTPGQIIDRDRRRWRGQRLAVAGGVCALALVAGVWANWAATEVWRAAFASQAQFYLDNDGDPGAARPYAIAAAMANGDVIGAGSNRGEVLLKSIGSALVVQDYRDASASVGGDQRSIVFTSSVDDRKKTFAEIYFVGKKLERAFVRDVWNADISPMAAPLQIR